MDSKEQDMIQDVEAQEQVIPQGHQFDKYETYIYYTNMMLEICGYKFTPSERLSTRFDPHNPMSKTLRYSHLVAECEKSNDKGEKCPAAMYLNYAPGDEALVVDDTYYVHNHDPDFDQRPNILEPAPAPQPQRPPNRQLSFSPDTPEAAAALQAQKSLKKEPYVSPKTPEGAAAPRAPQQPKPPKEGVLFSSDDESLSSPEGAAAPRAPQQQIPPREKFSSSSDSEIDFSTAPRAPQQQILPNFESDSSSETSGAAPFISPVGLAAPRAPQQKVPPREALVIFSSDEESSSSPEAAAAPRPPLGRKSLSRSMENLPRVPHRNPLGLLSPSGIIAEVDRFLGLPHPGAGPSNRDGYRDEDRRADETVRLGHVHNRLQQCLRDNEFAQRDVKTAVSRVQDAQASLAGVKDYLKFAQESLDIAREGTQHVLEEVERLQRMRDGM